MARAFVLTAMLCFGSWMIVGSSVQVRLSKFHSCRSCSKTDNANMVLQIIIKCNSPWILQLNKMKELIDANMSA